MERLDCHVQNYDWGKKGTKSDVARIYAAGHNAVIDENKCYAELWMGTHPDGPARLKNSQVKLSTFIADGETLRHGCPNEKHLPFIMKLMSVEKALSLQVHPTKQQAAELNDRDPIHYPDRNHKPELAFAWTRFELLCGFRPAAQISINMSAFPELKQLMGKDTSEAFQVLVDAGILNECETMKAALAVCFKEFIATKDSAKIAKLIESMLSKLDSGIRGCLSDGTANVIKKIAQDFPGDIGCFSPLFLNHLILEPGECCYYAAEELHAYLSGECVECVGCSNNTIRAACTPKYIDVETLCKILSYRMTDPSYYIVKPVVLKDFPHVVEYAPDCKDFTLHEIKVSVATTDSPLPIPCLDCGSIMVLVEGEAIIENLTEKNSSKKIMTVSKGDIIYIQPRAQICFINCLKPTVIYRTFSFEEGPDHSKRNLLADSEVHKKIKVQRKGRAKYLVVDEDAEIFDVETEMDGVC
ncbi:unnamed protein product [Dracunculus medinensis]|uniref:mannose-6-phosphate isomerase n=1 Tax=Dracunculus medinensis TaxID=318479 RepID=A0A158Q358_DRAME|nr:unnamed protein product [Dracunculus medinensis]